MIRSLKRFALPASLALLFSITLATGGTATAASVAGVNLVDRVSVGDNTFSLQGAGLRKKFFIQLYVGSLYLDNALIGADADTIVEADAPMFIQLDVLSDLLTREKLIEALAEGFRKSTNDNTAPIDSDIEAMNKTLVQTVSPGDRFRIFYIPGEGTRIERSGMPLITIPGLVFKRAAFGIWLSEQPAQASLREAMLGN